MRNFYTKNLDRGIHLYVPGLATHMSLFRSSHRY